MIQQTLTSSCNGHSTSTLAEVAPAGSRPWTRLQSLTVMILLIACTLAGCTLSRSAIDTKLDMAVTKRASGMFEVTLTPEGLQDVLEGTTMGRISIDKTFHGDLEATSKEAMLSVRTNTKGSAGYVAIELVSGTLHGRCGDFVLQHSAVMSRGIPHQIVEIVPDSGSDELEGLRGTMTISIIDGKHFYELVYTLPEAD